MEAQHINVKVFVEGELGVDAGEFIGVFQRWVKEQHREELLIDMADYRHVPNGPGVMCVGLEADYAMDHRSGRWGLLYNRKAPLAGSNGERMAQALRAAASACEKLEAEVQGLKFSRMEFEVLVNDRGAVSNSAADWEAFKGEVEGFVKGLGGGTVGRLSEDPRSRLGATVRLSAPLDFARMPAGAPA